MSLSKDDLDVIRARLDSLELAVWHLVAAVEAGTKDMIAAPLRQEVLGWTEWVRSELPEFPAEAAGPTTMF